MTARQSLMQVYAAAVAALFAVYFAKDDIKYTDIFLSFVASFSLACSAVLYTHHRVMQRLQALMTRCERYAQEDITLQGKGTTELFYFYDPDIKRMANFHVYQKRIQRLIFAAIFLGACMAAISVVWRQASAKGDFVDFWPLELTVVLTALSTLLPFLDMQEHDGETHLHRYTVVNDRSSPPFRNRG